MAECVAGSATRALFWASGGPTPPPRPGILCGEIFTEKRTCARTARGLVLAPRPLPPLSNFHSLARYTSVGLVCRRLHRDAPTTRTHKNARTLTHAHAQICSEAYDSLPSLAESLRLNRARKNACNADDAHGSGSGGRASPRTAHLGKTRARADRAAERNKRREAGKRREAHVHRRHCRPALRMTTMGSEMKGEEAKKEEEEDLEPRKNEDGGGGGGTVCVGDDVGGAKGEDAGGLAAEGSTSAMTAPGGGRRFRGKRRRHHSRSSTCPTFLTTGEAAAVEKDTIIRSKGSVQAGGHSRQRAARDREHPASTPLPPSPLPQASLPGRTEGGAGAEATGGGDGAGKQEGAARIKRSKISHSARVITATTTTDTRPSKTGYDKSSQLSDTPDVDAVPASTALSTSGVEKTGTTVDFARRAGNGVRRAPGVWTRRGVWAPANEQAEDRTRVEERRLGDRQRQVREDEVGG